jgi:hypothetical protein
MALDLNEEKAIDYSSNLPFLPFEALGSYVFDINSYVEHEGYNGNGDLLTVTVVESTNDTIRKGTKFVFYFKTDVTGKAKAFAAARLRSFIRSAVGVPDSEARTFDANAARKALLEEDLSKGGNLVRMSRRAKPGKGDNSDKEFADDRWEPHVVNKG